MTVTGVTDETFICSKGDCDCQFGRERAQEVLR